MTRQVKLDWARDFIADTLVWDAHAGIFPGPDTDLGGLPAWRGAGVDYVSLNIGFDVMNWTKAIATLSAYRRKLAGMSDKVSVVKSINDIQAARASNRLAVSFDIEGVNALNGDIGMVSAYYDLGVRQMLLAYNLNNAGSGGCHDNDTSLTVFGKRVVEEMNRVGIMLDCSHMGLRSSLEAIAHSSKPSVFTHSNPVALCDHQRNISDEQIKACAAAGGVVGINGMGIFLGENDVSAETFAKHVNYVADLAGPEHVGIGLDWKPPMKKAPNLGAILASRPDYWPAGQKYDTPGIRLFAPAQIAEILVLLRQNGWTEGNLRAFLGGNFLRVATQNWTG